MIKHHSVIPMKLWIIVGFHYKRALPHDVEKHPENYSAWFCHILMASRYRAVLLDGVKILLSCSLSLKLTFPTIKSVSMTQGKNTIFLNEKANPLGWLSSHLMLGSSLLSHGETSHTTIGATAFHSEFGMGSWDHRANGRQGASCFNYLVIFWLSQSITSNSIF